MKQLKHLKLVKQPGLIALVALICVVAVIGLVNVGNAENELADPSFWSGAYTLDDANDVMALANIVSFGASDPAFAADVGHFIAGFVASANPADNAQTANNIINGKFIMTDNITLAAASGFSGIGGYASTPFGGSINGNGHTIDYVIDSSESQWVGRNSFALIPFGTTEAFYNLNVRANLTIDPGLLATAAIGGIVGTANGAVDFENVSVDFNLTLTTNQTPKLAVGGFIGTKAAAPVTFTGSAAAMHTTYNSTTLKSLVESSTVAGLPAAEQGVVTVMPMTGFSVYAFGQTVRELGDGRFAAEPGSTVYLVAVNEKMEFGGWVSNIGITATTYYTNFVMPANGSGVTLGVSGNPNPALGRSFATAYVMDSFDKFNSLQIIVNNDGAAVPADYAKFSTTKSAANRTMLLKGYYKLDRNITLDTSFTGIGVGDTTSTNSFCGFFDGGYVDGGDLKSYTITFSKDLTSAATNLGLFGHCGTGGYAVVRNVNFGGQLHSAQASAAQVVAGAVAGYAKNTVFDNVHAQTEISVMDSAGAGGTHVGGLVGRADGCYVRKARVSNVPTLRVNTIKPIPAYLGGAFGSLKDSFVDDLNVEIGYATTANDETVYRYSVFELQTGGPYSGVAYIGAGGIVGYLNMSTQNMNVMRNVSLTSYQPDQPISCLISARIDHSSKALNAYSTAGGIVGLANGVDTAALIDGLKMELHDNVTLDIVSQDVLTTGDNRVVTYAGGIMGATVANLPTVTADLSNLINGKVNVTTRRYGGGAASTGGISGRNLAKYIDVNTGKADFVLKDMNILSEHKSTFKFVGDTAGWTFTGGICGTGNSTAMAHNSAGAGTVSDISLVATNVNISTIREDGNTMADGKSNFGAGGIFGFTNNGASGALRNVSLTLIDSKVNSHELSSVQKTGNVAAGGIAAFSTTNTMSNLHVAVKGDSTISGVIYAMPGDHNVADVYVGGVIGSVVTTNTSFVENASFTGDYVPGSEHKNLTLEANQGSNSPCIGGIGGYMPQCRIRDALVDSVSIYGEAYTGTIRTDTDVIVGGAVGLVNGTSYSPASSVDNPTLKNILVQNSKINALGRYYTLTYAGGVLAATYGCNATSTMTNCVAYNNEITAQSQKLWSAVGGVGCYMYDTSSWAVINCGSFDNKLTAIGTGDTVASPNAGQSGRYFDSFPSAGGIIGRTSYTSAMTANVINCFSNSTIILQSPKEDRTWRGGIGGYRKYNSDVLNVKNSFFEPSNAGTTKTTEYAVGANGTTAVYDGLVMLDGVRNTTVASTAMNTSSKVAETYTDAALDFNAIALMDGPGLNSKLLFKMVNTNGDSGGGATPAKVTVVSSDPSRVQITPVTSGTFGFTATKVVGCEPGLVYAEMYVWINGKSYLLNKKPILVGVQPASSIRLFHDEATSENEITTDTTMSIATDDESIPAGMTLISDIAYDDEDIVMPDLTRWEFSLTADFAVKASIANIMSFATVTENGETLSIVADRPIETMKVFYVRAVYQLDSAVKSPVVQVNVIPKYVTGAKLKRNTGGAFTGNSFTSPLVMSVTAYYKMQTEVIPANASVKSFNVIGYKVDQGTGALLSTVLPGVKSDGSLFAVQLLDPAVTVNPTSAKVIQDEVFAVVLVTNGKADPSWTDSNNGIPTGYGTLTASQSIQSVPIYVKLSNSCTVTVRCEGALVSGHSTEQAVNSFAGFTTIPDLGRQKKPDFAYYTVNDGEPIHFDISQNTEVKGDGSSYTFLNDASRTSQFRIFVPDGATEVKVYIGYFRTVTVSFLSMVNGVLQLAEQPREMSVFVKPEDIPTSATKPGYTLGGWASNNLQTAATSLSQYDYVMRPSTQEATDEGQIFHDLMPVPAGTTSFILYAVWQYNVTFNDSAAMEPLGCANNATLEVGSSTGSLANSVAPLNDHCAYVVKVTKPASYLGSPIINVKIGTTEYTHSPSLTWVNGAGGTKVANYTIPASELVESKIGSGITISVYHANGYLFSTGKDTITDESGALLSPTLNNSRIPADGVFTFVYNVNHVKGEQRSTYGYAHGNDLDDFKFTFSRPIPVGTVLRVYRRFGTSLLNDKVPYDQEIYWYKITTAKAYFELSELYKMGANTPGVTCRSFDSYLSAGDAFHEQFFVTVTPPTYADDDETKLLTNTDIIFGYGDITKSPSTDDKAVTVTKQIHTDAPIQQLLSFGNGSTNTSGSIEYSATAAGSNNYRHENSAFGLAVYYVDSTNKVIIMPEETVFSFTTESGKVVFPDFVSFFSKACFVAANGTYSITFPEGYTLPADAHLRVDLYEVPADSIHQDMRLGRQVVKLLAGERRSRITIS